MSEGRRPRVFVTRNVPKSGVDLLSKTCEVTQWRSDELIPHDELIKGVEGVDALYCLLTDNITAEVLDSAGSTLKVVGTMSVGYDHIDLQECRKRNIAVGNTPKVSTDDIADHTILLLLAAARRLPEAIHEVKTGGWGPWKPMWLCGAGITGKKAGVVGLGRIGFAVAQRLRGFGVSRLVYHDAYTNPQAESINAEQVSLDELLRECDFVISCCNLTGDTKGMFNKEVFAKMKDHAIFVNTGRGGLVHHDELYTALKSGHIRAAGLDVTDPEPLPTDHPLLTLDNCIVTPHVASAVMETREVMSDMTARNILAAFSGEPLPGSVVERTSS